MAGFITNIEEAAESNDYFRKVLFTAEHSQLVVMSLKPGEDIGMEVHNSVDQFIRIEKGDGKAIMNGEESSIHEGSAIVIPAGTKHDIVNTGDSAMKLYTVYAPPNHRDGTVHYTKEDALKDDEHY